MIAIAHLRQTRRLFAGLADAMDQEQLFQIPDGFNNHVAWNVAHVVATQQVLHYTLSGLEPTIAPEWIKCFRKGSTGEHGTPEAFTQVMEHVHSSVDRLEKDYEAGIFSDFKAYETSAGIRLSNIEEAIQFNNLHEGIHLGYVMAMRRCL